MKLSIITINFNNKSGLEKTIRTVINQTFKDFEYIIVDGGSTDGSMAVIENFKADITHWVSEADKGVYDAMNKGIQLASGDYLLMLNSGDYLVRNDVLEQAAANLQKGKYDIIYADLIWEDQGSQYGQQFPDALSFDFFRKKLSLGHQAAFIKRSLHHSVGLYDTNLRISADWKFFVLAICKYNVSYLHLPFKLSVCGRDGISCDPANLNDIYKEKNSVLAESFSAFLPDYTTTDNLTHIFQSLKENIFIRILKKLRLVSVKLNS